MIHSAQNISFISSYTQKFILHVLINILDLNIQLTY